MTSRLFILRLSGLLLCTLLVPASLTPAVGDERHVFGFVRVASEEMQDPRFKETVILVTPEPSFWAKMPLSEPAAPPVEITRSVPLLLA